MKESTISNSPAEFDLHREVREKLGRKPIFVVYDGKNGYKYYDPTIKEQASIVVADTTDNFALLSAKIVPDAVIISEKYVDDIYETRWRRIRSPRIILSSDNSYEGAKEATAEFLNSGVADYIQQPYNPKYVITKAESIVRRLVPELPKAIEMGDMEINLEERNISKAGLKVELSSMEWRLLTQLIITDRSMSRSEILAKVWGLESLLSNSRGSLDVYLVSLRHKLGEATIFNLPRVGYKIASFNKVEYLSNF